MGPQLNHITGYLFSFAPDWDQPDWRYPLPGDEYDHQVSNRGVKHVRILYRGRQFWHTLSSKIDSQKLEQAATYLTHAQWELFTQLQVGEKNHALAMLTKLIAQGETEPDLLVAALLHDVGKLRYRMNPLERALVVVGKAIVPEKANRWGTEPVGGWNNLPDWRKAFIVAEHHAEWGAEMARQAGASPLAVELIRQHPCPPSMAAGSVNNRLQKTLWLVDNES